MEIDSLEIVIQSEVEKVNKNLDALIGKLGIVTKGISAIRSNKGLDAFAKRAEEISKSMNKVSDSAKYVSDKVDSAMDSVKKSIGGIEKPAEKAKKSIESIVKEISDRTMNITPELNFENVSGEIKKYESQIRNSQNQLNRIMESSTADKQVKSMERLVIKINEAQNALKKLQEYNKEGEISAEFNPKMNLPTDEVKRSFDEIIDDLDGFILAINKGTGNMPFAEMQYSIEELTRRFPEATKEIEFFKSEFEKLYSEKYTRREMASPIPEGLLKSDNAIDTLNKNISNAESKIFDFKKVIDGIRPLDFSGNFFEMEKWVDSLQKKLETLYTKQERLNDLGVNPNTRGMKNLSLDIEQITRTLDIYEEKLEKARDAGKLDIKIPDIDAPIDNIVSKTRILIDNLSNIKINISANSLQEVERQIEKVKQQYDAIVDRMIKSAAVTPFYGASVDFKKKQVELSALRQRYQDFINKQKELSVSGEDPAKAFQEKLKALVIPEIKISDPKKLQNHLKKLEADLDKFKAKLQNDITMGRIVVDDSGYQKAQEQIALTEKSIEATKQKISEVGSGGADNLSKSMQRASSSGKNLDKTLSGISKRVRTVFSNIKNLASKGFNMLTKGIKSAVTGIGKLIKSFTKLNKENKKTNISLAGGFKTLLKYAFGIRSLFVLLNKIRSGFGEGLDNLVQYSSEANYSMSIMTSALGRLKNSFAVAFAPIMNVVAPYITAFIDMLGDAFNAVGRFFTALTGKKISVQASKYYKDYAASLDGVADAADKADKALHTLGIDELNILSETKTDKDSMDVSIEDMFHDMEVEDAISDWADRIRDAFKKGNWEELGSTIAEMLNTGLRKVYDKLEEITPKVEQALKNFSTAFNSFVADFDWELLGQTVGAGINLLVKSFNALAGDDGINFELLGEKLSVGFRGLVDKIEWRELGNALGNGFMIPWRILDGFITDMSRKDDLGLSGWAKLGIGLGNAVNGLADRINFDQIIRVLTEGFKGILETLENLIATIEWQKLIDKFNAGIESLRKGISWDNLGERITGFTNQITKKVNMLADGIKWNEIGRTIGTGVNTIVNTLNQLIEGIEFKDIGSAISDGLNGIVEEVEWEDLGNLIGNALMIIPDIVYGAVSDFEFDDAGIALGEALNGIVEKIDFETIFSTLGKLLTGLGDFMINFAETFDWTEFGTKISDGINAFFRDFDGAKFAEGAISFISGLLDSITVAIQNIEWSEVWVDVVEFLVTALVGAVEIIDKLLEAAFYLIKGLFEGLIKAIAKINWSDVWEKILKAFKIFFGIHSPSTVMEEQGGFLMQGLINGISAFVDKVIQTFNELGDKIVKVWDDIKKSFQEKWESITDWWKNSAIVNWWNNDVAPWFTKEKWSELYDSVKTSLQGKWDELRNWWQNTNFSEWIDGHVKPFFKKEKWAETYDTVKASLQEKWDELRNWWSNTDFSEWIDNHVNPYFTKEKWMETYDAVKSGLEGKWNEMKTWWNNSAMKQFFEKDVKPYFNKNNWSWDGIKEGLSEAWNGAVQAIKDIWNNFANWLNDKLKFEIPPLEIMGNTIFGGTTIDFGKIPTFSTGGFPEDGLFMANHTELVGKFANGQTAVANNAQIIAGIEEAAYRGFLRAQSETSPYLADIAENTRRTAEKDMSVRIGDRDIYDANKRASSRLGWAY